MANKFDIEALRQHRPKASETAQELFKPTADIFEKNNSAIDMLPGDKLVPYSKHPFKIRENERLEELIKSIEEQGILVPLIVRVHPTQRGCYEILAGHHRHVAGQRVNITEYPCIIKNVDDNVAALIVVESNKQRGFADMLPSEIAFALKLEYEAMKCQGKRTDILQQMEEILNEEKDKYNNGGENETSAPMEQKLESGQKIGEKNDMSSANVRRYIRLTLLIPSLLDKVDKNEIALRPAVDLSFIKADLQQIIVDCLDVSAFKVDMKKAEKLKEYAQQGKLTTDTANYILSGAIFEVKAKAITKISVPYKKVQEYIPKTFSQKECEDYVITALKYYQENFSE